MSFYTNYPVYPTALLSSADYPNQTDDVSWIWAALINAIKDEMIAVQTELGTNPKGSDADVKARLDGLDTTDGNLIKNILLNSFRIQMNGSLSIRNFIDAFSDEFEDTAGVDTDITDATYDDVNDRYSLVSPVSKGQTVSFADQTIIESLGHPVGGYKDKVTQGLKIDMSQSTFTKATVYITRLGMPGDITVRIETDSAGEPSGTLAHANATATIPALSVLLPGVYDAVFIGDVTLAAATQYWLVMSLAAEPPFNNYFPIYGAQADVYPNGHYEYHPNGGAWTVGTEILDQWFTLSYTATIVDVVSLAVEADSQPDDVSIIAWADLGTGDIDYYVSRDDGTTWTLVALTEIATETGSIKIYAGDADISAQPADKTIRIKACISGNATLSAWGLAWR